ncbi:UDP-N-acetylglucosamine--N-acetylmuramyl-(pentapeptide) pyrophosphoryl-undecaprenol N-acetylglucosamine transferase [Candidatus Dependentiae bacterium]|nr:UDP-N-acetylglucosamine--N-acetylmuramyl-(pentapeptide) pyrophosphoryl-undecaprenol N-acetylglucosamine transferase [Candidatus Dependentiae bacterium]
MDQNKYIACVAASSGGHIIPTLTLAQDFLARNPDHKILLFSTSKDLDKKIIDQYSCISRYEFLNFNKQPGIFNKINFLTSFFPNFWQSLKILKKTKPSEIICTGGYICIPVGVAAWLLKIPVNIFELNAIPGKTNKLLSYFASDIYIIFENASKSFRSLNCKLVEYPVRFNSKNIIEQKEAILGLNLDPAKKTVLILGGSQGSIFLNQLIKKIFDQNLYNDFQIIHQTGKNDCAQMQEFFDSKNIKSIVFDYHHDLSKYYCAADLIICRAGAGTLFEIKFFNKKAAVIPLETNKNDHQLYNALAMQNAHSQNFKCIRQHEAFEKLNEILENL